MCQAIPRRVLQVAEGRAEVLYDGVPTWVATSGLPGLTPGEYVVVYAGQALERMPTADAEEMLAYLEELERMYAELLL